MNASTNNSEENNLIEKSDNEINDKVDKLLKSTNAIIDQNIELRERLVHIEDKINELKSITLEMIDSSLSCISELDESQDYDYGVFGMWYTQNYGAALTSFAIGKLLQKMGYSIIQIDLPRVGGEPTAYNLNNEDRKFIQSSFATTQILKVGNVNSLNNICKNFIVPSDSLWGGGYEYQLYDLRGCLLGEFATQEKGIISFSTSFGAWNPKYQDSIERQYFSLLLRRFSHVSVREKRSIKMCKELFGIDASWTLDPVLLLDKEDYIEQCIESGSEEKYILAYILELNDRKKEQLEFVSSILGINVVLVPDMNEDHIAKNAYDINNTGFQLKNKISVNEWLTLIKDATYVVTDSYHGMLFSLIFEKQFITLEPKSAACRFYDISDWLGIDNRVCLTDNNQLNTALKTALNYEEINKKLNEKATKDRDELMNSLNDVTHNSLPLEKSNIRTQMLALRLKRSIYE